ncbi:MAG: hypothetical protein JSV88_26555 [Candidatus Aminicenantes bacterium]|nr:MAG: hypothetical protein JSV88_26555 [Candidatus Aminicenantes bacterium]
MTNNKTPGESRNQITIVGPISGNTRALKRDIIEDVVDVSHLRESFSGFMTSLREIVGIDVPSTGSYELEEIQFSAEISANGDFKLLGTGVGLEAKGGVTFTLKRKN